MFARFLSVLARPLKPAMDRHVVSYRNRIADCIAPVLEDGWRVLDVGCDSGQLARLLMDRRPSLAIEGVDIQDIREAVIPRTVYDGRHLPFPDGSFDAVMAVDMLHHTRHILELLTEMRRVARRAVIVKDHRSESPFSWLLVGLGDQISNAPYGVPCAFNFPSLKRWNRYFREAGLALERLDNDLDLGPGTLRKYNPMFVLRPVNAAPRVPESSTTRAAS